MPDGDSGIRRRRGNWIAGAPEAEFRMGSGLGRRAVRMSSSCWAATTAAISLSATSAAGTFGKVARVRYPAVIPGVTCESLFSTNPSAVQ